MYSKFIVKKQVLILLLFVVQFGKTYSQLAGTYSVPGSYSNIASAINDLNINGVSGPVTINIAAGFTETVPFGGFSLTATGTATSPIVFQKNGAGANPLVIGYAGGTATPSNALQDGIWRLIGSDYVTIDGLDLQDPNTSNPSTMEFGFGLFKANTTNGCNNNTIKNCAITLNRINIGNGSVTAVAGSRGIDVVNAASSAHTTSLSIALVAGANSNNKFYNNLIQNCNVGVSIIGFVDVSPFSYADQNNDVGGLSAITGNTIINFGGGSGTNNPATGVKTLAQYYLNVSYNIINSNNGFGVNHIYDLGGIHVQNATSANAAITNNTISVKGGGTTGFLFGIQNNSGLTPAYNISNISSNLISNCTYSTSTGGAFFGIYNVNSASTLIISNNTFTNNSSATPGGNYANIYNTGSAPYILFNNNNAGSISLTGTGSAVFTNIFNLGGSGVYLSLSSNTLEALTFAPNSATQFKFIDNSFIPASGSNSIFINANVLKNVSLTTSGIAYFINDNTGFQYNVVSGNSMSNFTTTGTGNIRGYYNNTNPSSGSSTISSNSFSNIVNASGAAMVGISYAKGNFSFTTSIISNTIANIFGVSSIVGISASNLNTAIIQNNVLSTFSVTGSMNGITLNGNGTNSLNVFNNSISSFTSTGFVNINGYSQGNVGEVKLYNNKIFDFVGTSTACSISGLSIAGGTLTNAYNNIIGNLNAPNTIHLFGISGIDVNDGIVVNLYNNTVRLASASTSTFFGTSALYLSSNTTSLNAINNIFINLSTPGSSSGASVAFRTNATSIATYSTTSNNNLFYAGIPSTTGLIYKNGNTSHQTLSAFKSYSSPRDAFSFTENTNFLSTVGATTNFLHINPPSFAESNALAISGVTTDIDGDVRHGNIGYTGNGSAPDIGADEFNTPNCYTITQASILGVSVNLCAGQTATLTKTDYPAIPSVQGQWQVSTTSGGSYTNSALVTGTIYTTGTLSPGTYYYVLANTCTVSNQIVVSNEVTVTVNPYPILSMSPLSSTLCGGSGSITLTASGANSYTWSPSLGLSNSNGSVVNASPSSTSTYIVTGSNLGGCTGTANTASCVVNVILSAGTISALPTSTTLCQGSSAVLQALATSSVYSVSSISYAPILTPTNGVGTLCSNGSQITSLTSGNLDDGDWYILPIPFGFNFFATTYTGCAVSTNGFLTMGSTSPPTYNGYGNALPSGLAGRPCIGSVYGNLTFASTGTINTFTTGTSPNRKFVVNWLNGKFSTGPTGTITTQVILYESSNIIEVHTATNTGQYAAVEGIQNASGSVAYVVPGRNNQTYTLNNDAYRWNPNPTYSWLPSTYLSSTSNSITAATNIQSNITYTAFATTANGCAMSATVGITVNPSPTLAVSSGTTALCGTGTVNISASGANSYTWSTGAFTSTVNVNPAVTTTYVVSGSGTLNSCIASANQVITVIPLPTLSIIGSTAICSGQNVSLTVSGANSYLWNSGSTNSIITPSLLINTTFSVIGTSSIGGCTGNSQITVTVFPNPTLSITGNTLICSGQNATLNALGADTFLWSNSVPNQSIIVSPLSTGVYSVIGTNTTGACTSTALVTLSVNPSPTLSVSGNTIICVGQSLSIGASGANTYSWNTSLITASIIVAPSITTIYSVTGTSTIGGCTDNAVLEVTVVPIPTISIIGTNSICAGQSATLIASGATTYSWNNGSTTSAISVSPNINSSYTVIGVSGPNCSSSTTKTLNVFALPNVSIFPNPSASICEGETAILTGSVSAQCSYLWSNASTINSISVAPVVTTLYSLQVSSSVSSCTNSASFNLFVNPCTVINNFEMNNTLKIYPNPFQSIFDIEIDNAETAAFEIYDISGRVVYFGTIFDNKATVDIGNLAKGIYYIKINLPSTLVVKIVKD